MGRLWVVMGLKGKQGTVWGLPGGSDSRESACNVGNPLVGKMPWRREGLPTPVFLPGESHGQRSLEGHRPRGPRESDTTERLMLPVFLGGAVWLPAGLDPASQMALTTAAEILTGADLALCDIQDEGVRSRAEVAGALSRGEMGGVEESHTLPGAQARGPRGSDLAGQEPSVASFPGLGAGFAPA